MFVHSTVHTSQKKPLSQGSLIFTNYYYFLSTDDDTKRKLPKCYNQLLYNIRQKTFFSPASVPLTIQTGPHNTHFRTSAYSQANKFKALNQSATLLAHLALSLLKSSNRWRNTYSAEPTLKPACKLNHSTPHSTALMNNYCSNNDQFFVALSQFDAIKCSSLLNFLSHSLKKSTCTSIYLKKLHC